MRIVDILKNKKQGVSFEFFPPKTEAGKERLKKSVEALEACEPLYLSMTYGAGGTTREETQSAVSFILKKYRKLEVMPHLTCIGSDEESIKVILDKYKAAGVDNLMALRGDIPDSMEGRPKGKFCYASDIVRYIKNYGHFGIGVAVYPQGHIESKSLEDDLEYTKIKVDSGADFAITQMFFDNRYYYDFMEKIRNMNINIPVIPGILPLTNLYKAEKFCSGCGVAIPSSLKKKLERFKGNPEDMAKAGLDITISQCRDLVGRGFRHLHIFTLNKSAAPKRIVEAVYPVKKPPFSSGGC